MKAKSWLSKIDRLIGYRFWRMVWSFLSKDKHLCYHCLSQAELKNYFPNLDKQDLKSRKYHTGLGESYIIRLGKSFVEGGTGWVYHRNAPHSKSFPYAAYPWRQYFYPHFLFHLLKIRLSKTVKLDQAVNLVWHGWSNYYHFLIDVLPILDLLNDSFEEVNVLVPKYVQDSSFVQDYYEMFPGRYSALKFIYFDPDQVAEVGQLFLANKSRFFGLPKYPRSSSKGIKRLFLMRPLKGQRTIINLDQLVPILHQYEFQVIDTSSMSLEDQIATFQDVEYLVGIHGAGMTNLIFSDKLKLVIEVFPGGVFKPLHYQHLVQMKGGVAYGQLTGGEVIVGTVGHFELSPRALDQALENVFVK